MSKRFIISEHNNDRKRAKLNISISDHNFPLSQNNDNNKGADQAWGDDNDDEMLLLASQACEQVYTQEDISTIPDYSLFVQPCSTSTQALRPSTPRAEFAFKKPSVKSPSTSSTSLRQKCTTVSSPLPGLSTEVMKQTNDVNLSDDLILNDKIYKGNDSDYVYRQLLQLQEENAKLKSENGKLLEKCVTKEGEASILRTQLKSCQVAVDNARLDKIKAQERVQMEWSEKLTAANCQMRDLRTQLDFKNLEIISTKEKCKKLESTKVKLTQVTVGGSDLSTSHRPSSSPHMASQSRRVKMSSSAVQTETKSHFLDVNTAYVAAPAPPAAAEADLATLASLLQVKEELELISQRTMTAFRKETDEKYIEGTSTYLHIEDEDLLKERALFPGERAGAARRELLGAGGARLAVCTTICTLLANTSCAPLYSGLVMSMSSSVLRMLAAPPPGAQLLEAVRALVGAQASLCAAPRLLRLLRAAARGGRGGRDLCARGAESCCIQVVLKQLEACLTSIERQDLVGVALSTTRDLVAFYSNVRSSIDERSKCECRVVLVEVLIYALRICAVMMDRSMRRGGDGGKSGELLALCRCGGMAARRVGDLAPGRARAADRAALADMLARHPQPAAYAAMLTELSGTVQATPEDLPPSFHNQPWLNSFKSFSITD